jgi:uncharacterized protein (TIGR02099 family)
MGHVDVSANLQRANAQAVWRYLPLVVNANARQWLKNSLRGGQSDDVSLRLQGDLWHFPFRAGAEARPEDRGIFRVQGRFRDGRLDFAEGWPGISDIDGELLFDAARMVITGKQGKLGGAALANVNAEIKDLGQPRPLLEITGKAAGATSDFLGFIEASPVGGHINHVTAAMRAEGRGELDLRLELPLDQIDQTRVEGRYRLDGNRLLVHDDVPVISDVRGQLRFTGELLEARGLRGRLLDGPVNVDIRTGKEGRIDVSAEGEVSIAALRQSYPNPFWPHLSGSTKWNGAIRIQNHGFDLMLSSDLAGVASSLPPPLNKTSTALLPLKIGRTTLPPEPSAPGNAAGAKVGAGGTAAPELLGIELSNVLAMQFVRPPGGGQQVSRGSIAIGRRSLPLPREGIEIAGTLAQLDADAWRATMASLDADNEPAQNRDWLQALPIRFDLRTDELTVFDKKFANVQLQGRQLGSSTRVALQSPDLTGDFNWDRAGSGRIEGRIGELAIPESLAQPDSLNSEVGEIVEKLPALDIAIGRLKYKGRELGGVKVAAENRDRFWNARFAVDAEETKLNGTLRWRPDPAASETRLEFDLGTRDIEKFLGRLGHPETIRRGTAELKGHLVWRGAPVAIDYPTLAGVVTADAATGQFTQLEPGVGRLLGVLSLQSLPRRITLDFRDVFSEGFAFDRILGNFEVREGVMRTNDLEIRGPSAKVLMKGSIDLAAETQNLTVRVQPAVGESIAVGAMLAASPVTGAIAWVAQKVLKDPLDQVFAFEYAVTGHWQDPKVDKLGQARTAPDAAGAPK